MKYRRKYTLFTLKNRKGKPVWYFRIYQKAMRYVEELLEDETMLRKVFESDLVVAIDSSHSLIQTTIREIPLFILPNVYISAN